MIHEQARRWVDEELVGELGAKLRPQLHDHLRSCPECRNYYDRGALALRIFENADGPSQAELDMVEQWIFEAEPSRPRSARAWWARPWFGMMGLVAAAAVALFILLPGEGDPLGDGFTARGDGDHGGLGLQVLCGDPLRPAEDAGCRLDERMTFAYRVAATTSAANLVLFGIDEHGDTLYYAPTPVNAGPIQVESGQWRPAPVTVDLGVNHEAGELIVYALVTTNAPTARDVDRLAAELVGRKPTRVGERAWAQTMSDEYLTAFCESKTECLAAEFSLVLHEAKR